MKIAVTGATGYIGDALLDAIRNKGFIPVALSRKKITNLCEWIPYDLNQQFVVLPENISCVVHLAMNFNLELEVDQKNEVESAVKIIKAAEKIGAKFIYLSSQTAAENAPTGYGKTKWKIEQIVTEGGGAIIRPGLVYGGKASGLFAQLVDLVSKYPVIPKFIPSPKTQPIHIKDLCEAILSVVELPNHSKIFCIASERPISFDFFLKQLAINKLHVYRLRVPIPRFIVNAAQKILPNNSALIRLKSLFNLPYMKTSEDLIFLNLKPRSLAAGLHSSGSFRRRSLIQEGYILYSYILRKRSNLFMTRRYVKFVELLRNGELLGFTRLLYFFPFLVSFLDRNVGLKNQAWYSEFMCRLNSATSLTEATIVGCDRFLDLNKSNSAIYAVFICIKAIFLEVLIRAVSFIIRPPVSSVFIMKVDSYES
jgi:NADH dehydrogenase